MRTIITGLLLLISINSHAAILVYSPNGQYELKPSLAAAAVAADAAGKTVVITSPQVVSTVVVWPADRELRFEKGGYITFTGVGSLTGLKEAKPEWFNSAQKAVDSANRILFTQGKTYTENIVITTNNKTLTGGGTINGSVTIDGTSTPVTNIKIHDLIFDRGRSDEATNKNAIQMKYCSGVSISNVLFKGVDKCIYVFPINIFQHVNRITISECTTEIDNSILYTKAEKANAMPHTYYTKGYPNYFYYVDNPYPGNIGGTMTRGAADVTIANCNPVMVSVSHIHALGQDGLVVNGNTFFSSGGYYRSPIKMHNIFIEYSEWVVISNNELFEAGEESILMHWVANATITGNNIAWPGQRDAVNGHGIRLYGGGTPVGDRFVSSTISNNNIRIPMGSGIVIEANHDIVTVIGNTTTAAGQRNFYYGDGTHPMGDPTATPTISGPRYGVSVDPTCYGVVVANNNNPMNYNNLPKSTATSLGQLAYAGPIDSNNYVMSGLLISTGGITIIKNEINVNGRTFIIMDGSVGGNINTISGGNNGKTINIYNGGPACTFVNSASIKLKGGVNYSLPYQSSLTLVMEGGIWYEVGRN